MSPTTLTTSPKYSVVVPLFNESDNIVALHRRVLAACQNLPGKFEIIFVDDGSTDNTFDKCRGLNPLTVIRLRKNFGQTAAFDAGFKQAQGEIIITLDGDLQNDPADFPLLLGELEKGFDVVSGWRHARQDNLSKHLASRGANFLRKFLFKDSIHDSGCALKAYRRECFDNLDLYGEMHRFIPALLEMQGFKIGEVKVKHYPRQNGVTKYNWQRYLRSLVDMLSIWFWSRYSARPLHLLGGSGIILSLIGVGLLTIMVVVRLVFNIELSDKIWPLIGVFLVLTGVQLFTIGIVTDILVKTYFRGQNRMNYSIRDTLLRT